MAQHDYDLVDAPTLTIRSEFNSILSAILSSNSGPLAPTEIYGGELWFKSDTGALSLRNSANTAWAGVPVDVDYLPVGGGTLAGTTGAKGNLTVNGTFSNPEYDLLRGNYIGTTAPTKPVAGMLWYDTSVNPALLRVRNLTNAAWLTAVDVATPVFSDALVVTAPQYAIVNLTSQGVTRRVYTDSASDWFVFDRATATAATMAILRDDGQLWLGAYQNWITGLINAKQAALGFTPIRLTGGNIPWVGGNPARLYVDGVDKGPILYGAPTPPLLQRGEVGALTYAYNPRVAVASGGTIAGSDLYYFPDGTNIAVGTWLNLSGNVVAGTVRFILQRIA